MSGGLISDLFVQAEIDYRFERAVSSFHPRPRARRKHHLSWLRHRDSTSHRQHPVLG